MLDTNAAGAWISDLVLDTDPAEVPRDPWIVLGRLEGGLLEHWFPGGDS
jgi:hypothetical protein